MPRVTIRNKRRVPVRWGGHIFPPHGETTLALDERRIARVRSQRALRVVRVEPDVEDYEKLNVADLRALAGTRSIDLPPKAKKADIVAALKDDDEEKEREDAGDERPVGEGVQGTLERALAEGIVEEAIDPTGILDAWIEDGRLIVKLENESTLSFPGGETVEQEESPDA